jgi:hypothetical protein
MTNRPFLQVRVRLILCLLAFSFFAITADAGSALNRLPAASYMEPYGTTLHSSFGTPPYTYSLTSGTLPPGITLGQSGNITGTPTTTGTWSFQITATDSSQPPQHQTVPYYLSVLIGLDLYGGLAAMPSPNGATGYFRVEKNPNNRWLFVDPLGNYFWLMSIYSANRSNLDSRVGAKYGGNWALWNTHRNSRMLSWQFNAIGEYNYQLGLPIDVNGGHNANPVKLPFIEEINAMYAMRGNPTMYGINEPPKDIVPGVPTTTYRSWRGSRMSDMLDPRMSTAYHNVVAYQNNRVYNGGFNTIPWLIGLTTDDTDGLFGLKAISNPNVGYMIAAVKFIYTAAENGGVTPIDPHLYSKYAWTCGYAGIDFGFGVGQSYLGHKYGTIAALNAAWGTGGFYTSFCDDGGYGVGTGVLDEDGRHVAWFGNDSQYLSNTSAGLKVDMNAMLYQYAYTYGYAAVSSIRVYDSHHLVFSPMTLGGDGYHPLPLVLQAFKDAGMGVIQVGGAINEDMGGAKATYDQTGLPVYFWYCLASNADSPFHGTTPDPACTDEPTQVARAAKYALGLNASLGAQATNGDNYILGVDYWAWGDSAGWQHSNWGLITNRDNAYNGTEDVHHSIVDSGGYTTIPEDANYGDFLTPITATNNSILQQLIYEWQH